MDAELLSCEDGRRLILLLLLDLLLSDRRCVTSGGRSVRAVSSVREERCGLAAVSSTSLSLCLCGSAFALGVGAAMQCWARRAVKSEGSWAFTFSAELGSWWTHGVVLHCFHRALHHSPLGDTTPSGLSPLAVTASWNGTSGMCTVNNVASYIGYRDNLSLRDCSHSSSPSLLVTLPE